MPKQSFEESLAWFYEMEHGKPPSKEELAAYVGEALEYADWLMDEFEEAHGYPASSEEELENWIDTKFIKEGIIKVH